jgi:tetratricopeptide (TPR) repeat protein
MQHTNHSVLLFIGAGASVLAQPPVPSVDAVQQAESAWANLTRGVTAISGWRLFLFLLASLVWAQQTSGTIAELFNLANLHASNRRYTEAESVLLQALRICEEAGDDITKARAWNALGELQRMRGRYAEAESAYGKARVILESKGGNPSDLPSILNNLGAVYRLTGRFSEAEKAIGSALAMWDSLRPEKVMTAIALNNLGQLRFAQGRYAVGDAFLLRAQQVLEHALGPDHPDLGGVLVNRGLILNRLHQFDESAQLLQRALVILEAASMPQPAKLVSCLNTLGLVEISRHRLAQADGYLSRAADLMERALPPDHPDFPSVWTNLGALYTAQARYTLAESMLKKALAQQVRLLGPDAAANYWTLNEYANLLRLTKRNAEAGRMELRAR